MGDPGMKGEVGPVGPGGIEIFYEYILAHSLETATNFKKLDEYSQGLIAGLPLKPETVYVVDVCTSLYNWLNRSK